MKNKMDQEYSFDLRPASMEEAGLFYSNDEQDEALGTVGHLRLDFGHGFLELRSTCYPHNDDQFDTLEFKMLLREFLEVLQENGPLASLSSMEAYCQKHGGAITEDGQTYGYIWETERYRFCLRCTPSPFEYRNSQPHRPESGTLCGHLRGNAHSAFPHVRGGNSAEF